MYLKLQTLSYPSYAGRAGSPLQPNQHFPCSNVLYTRDSRLSSRLSAYSIDFSTIESWLLCSAKFFHCRPVGNIPIGKPHRHCTVLPAKTTSIMRAHQLDNFEGRPNNSIPKVFSVQVVAGFATADCHKSFSAIVPTGFFTWTTESEVCALPCCARAHMDR